MHRIKSYETTITLFCRDGRVSHYPSLKAACKALGLGWISKNVGEHFRAYSHTSWRYTERRTADGATDRGVRPEKHYDEFRYVMRDDAGRPVTYGHCWSAARERCRAVGPKRVPRGPVEGAGRRRRYHFRRGERYINAVRVAATFEEEGEVAVRPPRGVALLPDRWDSYYRDNTQRNWKSFRKTAWK